MAYGGEEDNRQSSSHYMFNSMKLVVMWGCPIGITKYLVQPQILPRSDAATLQPVISSALISIDHILQGEEWRLSPPQRKMD